MGKVVIHDGKGSVISETGTVQTEKPEQESRPLPKRFKDQVDAAVVEALAPVQQAAVAGKEAAQAAIDNPTKQTLDAAVQANAEVTIALANVLQPEETPPVDG